MAGGERNHPATGFTVVHFSGAVWPHSDVGKWMPGSMEVFTEAFLAEPPDLPPGEIDNETDHALLPEVLPVGRYRPGIAVVGTDTTEPVLRLGIQGRSEDGWYPMSELKISK